MFGTRIIFFPGFKSTVSIEILINELWFEQNDNTLQMKMYKIKIYNNHFSFIEMVLNLIIEILIKEQL